MCRLELGGSVFVFLLAGKLFPGVFHVVRVGGESFGDLVSPGWVRRLERLVVLHQGRRLGLGLAR